MSRGASETLAAGTMVGVYRVERKLGAGGLGTVYEGVEPSIRKRVAIKVLMQDMANGIGVRRFLQETIDTTRIGYYGYSL